MLRKLLVALDGSEFSQAVLNEAVTLAKAMGAELLLLHVLTTADEGYPSVFLYPDGNLIDPQLQQELMERYTQQWKEFELQGMRMLKGLTDQAIAADVKADLSQSLGEPGPLICKTAQTWQADVILVGQRGLGRVRELFLGSVSNYVLHHAPCSVLVVPHSKLLKTDQTATTEVTAAS